MWHEVTVLFMTIPDRGGPEAADSLNTVEQFGVCFLEKMIVIPKVLSKYI